MHSMLLGKAIRPITALGLEGFDRVPSFLHRASHEPAHGMPLPGHSFHGVDQQLHLGLTVSQYVSV